jgi:hypothetical protein
MKSIRNFALAIAAGSLLAAGAVAADEAKPGDKPRAERHEHGKQGMHEKHGRMGEKHGRMGEKHGRMGEQGCPGMQQGRGEHDHS